MKAETKELVSTQCELMFEALFNALEYDDDFRRMKDEDFNQLYAECLQYAAKVVKENADQY